MTYQEIIRRLKACPVTRELAPIQLGMLADVVFHIADEAYAEGAAMARRLLRLQLGLATPDDLKD